MENEEIKENECAIESFNSWVYDTGIHEDAIDAVMKWFSDDNNTKKPVDILSDILVCMSLSLDKFFDFTDVNKKFQYMHRWIIEWYVSVHTFPSKTKIISDNIIALTYSMYLVDASCLLVCNKDSMMKEKFDKKKYCEVLLTGFLNLKYEELQLFLVEFAHCVYQQSGFHLDDNVECDKDSFTLILNEVNRMKNEYFAAYGVFKEGNINLLEQIRDRVEKIEIKF